MDKLYRINTDYSLILKSDNILLCSKDKKIKKFVVDENEVDDVKKILSKENFKLSNIKITKKLLNNNIIVKADNLLNNRNTELYLKSYTSSSIDLNRLKNSRVLVIGLGGIGCEIINHLIGVGIEKFIIVDYDVVEDTNFNRQYLYNKSNIGKKKTDILEKEIQKKNENSEIIKIDKQIETEEDLNKILSDNKIDIVVCAADNPFLDVRINVLKTCIKGNIPCVFGGVSIKSGQYGPTLVSNKAKNRYLNKLLKIKKIVIMSNINKASFGPTNSIISAYMSIDIIMTLLNKRKYISSLNKIKTFDFLERIDYVQEKI